ncbi:MAG: hypothetical protein WHS38_05800 [Thermodesulforhabdaceae bacterium]
MSYSDQIWGKPEPPIEILGESIKHLGVAHWTHRMMFAGFQDWLLRKYTRTFPVTIKNKKSWHPIFVLKAYPSYAHKVCPCTSKYKPKTPYIRAGCVLEHTGKTLTRTSFILEKLSFNIPEDAKVIDELKYTGRVPEECIKKNS